MARTSVLLGMLLVAVVGVTSADEATSGRVDCVYSSIAARRSDEYAFKIGDIPIEYCTHVIYDSIDLEMSTLIVMPSNPDYDFLQNGWETFVDLKKANPKLKLLMSLKGALTSEFIETAKERADVIDVIVSVLSSYKLDGISIFWFGYWRNAGAEEGSIYRLFEEMRQTFDRAGYSHWETNVMMVIDQDEIDRERICNVADSVSLVGVLNHANTPTETNAVAPLNSAVSDAGVPRNVSLRHSLQTWLDSGCPANKIVLGLVFMGTTYVLADTNKTGLFAPISGRGDRCSITRNDGACAYFELCQKINATGMVTEWDEVSVSPYAFQGDKWVGYENAASIERKARFAREAGLAGVWGLNLMNDDYSGKCGERFPLTKALWRGFKA